MSAAEVLPEELRVALGAVLEARIRLGLGERGDAVCFLLEEAASEVARVRALLRVGAGGRPGGGGAAVDVPGLG